MGKRRSMRLENTEKMTHCQLERYQHETGTGNGFFEKHLKILITIFSYLGPFFQTIFS